MSSNLRVEHRLVMFETRMLRRKLGFGSEEIIGYWIKVHNE
jgi:hypothetical protein